MARRGSAGDLLGAIETCLSTVRARADAAGITFELEIPVDPRLLRTDVAPLDQLGCHLLRYVIDAAMPGATLVVRLDLAADDRPRLVIIEERVAGRTATRTPGAANGAADDLAAARAILDAVGGSLTIARSDGRLHVSATLPNRPVA